MKLDKRKKREKRKAKDLQKKTVTFRRRSPNPDQVNVRMANRLKQAIEKHGVEKALDTVYGMNDSQEAQMKKRAVRMAINHIVEEKEKKEKKE